MSSCPDSDCRIELEKEIGSRISSKTAKWAIGITLSLFIFAVGYLDRIDSNAQDRAEANVAEINKEINKAKEERQEIKLDVEGMKKDIEYIKKSQETQEENDKEILNTLRKLNGDGS